MDRMSFVNFVAAQVRKNDSLVRLIRQIARRASPQTVLVLDYPVDAKPRWDQDHPHGEIHEILNRNRSTYIDNLNSFLPFIDYFLEIPVQPPHDELSSEPHWLNGWIHALDAVA